MQTPSSLENPSFSRANIGYLYPLTALQVDGGWALDTRVVDSLAHMASYLGAPVTLIATAVETATDCPASCSRLDTQGEGIRVVVVDASSAALDNLNLDVILALHSLSTAFAMNARTPVVLTSEFTFGIRHDAYRAVTDGLGLVRATLGLARDEIRLIRQLKQAHAVQFNGPAAARAYSRFSHQPMTFHDSRIRQDDVTTARSAQHQNHGRTLVIGFSGRLTKVKGPEFAIAVAREAHARGLPIELRMYGDGELASTLKNSATANVKFRGFVNFRDEWVPEVTEEVDVMLFPHVQGDPSCTYFESLGTGTPILAFDNVSARSIVSTTKAGWLVPRHGTEQMVRQLEVLLDNPSEIAQARTNGLDFMDHHHFEATTRRRTDHLIKVSGPSSTGQ